MILIDTGHLDPSKNALLPFLQAEKRNWTLFSSHTRIKITMLDFLPILDSGIKINAVYFNLPNRQICDAEILWLWLRRNFALPHHLERACGVNYSQSRLRDFKLAWAVISKYSMLFWWSQHACGSNGHQQIYLMVAVLRLIRLLVYWWPQCQDRRILSKEGNN